jgi:Ser/Thr protein kinase RdoA (MazF antagonist)
MTMGVWSTAEWLSGAVSWLDDRLAAAGIERTGEVTQPRLAEGVVPASLDHNDLHPWNIFLTGAGRKRVSGRVLAAPSAGEGVQ